MQEITMGKAQNMLEIRENKKSKFYIALRSTEMINKNCVNNCMAVTFIFQRNLILTAF
jgi:hypothetical protein